jgi:hypothetical protein
MKTFARLLALLLAMLTVLMVVVACDKGGDTSNNDGGGDSGLIDDRYDINGRLRDNLPNTLNYEGETISFMRWGDASCPEFEQENVTGDNVRDAVFGNVGTTISFRVSADDAPVLAKQFEPTFDESDLLQLNNRHFVISMIINGEKVPAFSATTLSIPSTPKDNFDAIVAHSREYYARPRLEVEEDIREAIEQSEKYKRELANSGRQEGDGPKLIIDTNSTPVFRPIPSVNGRSTGSSKKTEHKPNYHNLPSPQADLRRSGLSPNAAEGKERLGLKDLAKLAAEQSESKVEFKPAENTGSEKGNNKKKGKKNRKKNRKNQASHASPTPVSSPVAHEPKPARHEHGTAGSTPVTTPVKPEVEYQEKSTVQIQPSHEPIDLNIPIRGTDKFADKDNSMDGIISIKH